MTFWRVSAAGAVEAIPFGDAPLPLVFVAILASAMSAALSLLLGWHAFLVATCQVPASFRNCPACQFMQHV